MDLHEVFNNPNPTFDELHYVYHTTYSLYSTTEELNIILDYCFKNLKTVTARTFIQNIRENPASDEEILLRIKAYQYLKTLSKPSQ